jgi:hypothetical protein
MTTALRPLRIRLVDPTQVGGLLAYLRAHRCVAEQIDAVAIEVWPPPLLHENGNANGNGPASLACASCGEAVEAALERLGSPRCHDCRGRVFSDESHANGSKADTRERGRRAFDDLQAHLSAWRSETGAAAAIVD